MAGTGELVKADYSSFERKMEMETRMACILSVCSKCDNIIRSGRNIMDARRRKK